MRKRGLTLIELLVAMALAGFIITAIFHVSQLTGKQISIYMERYNAYSQIGYALDDMSLRLPSASRIHNPFGATSSAEDNLRTCLNFTGSSDVYNITPYEGDTEYRYEVNSTTGALVLEDVTNERTEVLVEGKFKPYVEFVRTWSANSEPDFCTIVITANCSKSASIGLPTKIVKAEGIKFWFVDIVAPN